MAEANDELSAIAERHGLSRAGVAAALDALERGGGTMAQFSHADFGGMAQWSSGGMSMVGDMFDTGLKARLDGVMADLEGLLQARRAVASDAPAPPAQTPPEPDISPVWWPRSLGTPSSAGAQNDMRYAVFPDKRRLVVEEAGRRTIYDTGAHEIDGVSQQQDSRGTMSFASQRGIVRLSDLTRVE